MNNKEITEELRALRKDMDKVLSQLEEEPMSEDDIQAYDQAMKDIKAGNTVSLEQLDREFED